MAIKIILTQGVEHLGDPGDIVRVTSGYARNFLFPKLFALEATVGNLKALETKRAIWKDAQSKEVDKAAALKARILAVDLTFVRKSGQGGVLFGSVTNADIAERLSAAGVELDRKQIQLKNPIKTIGDHEIGIKLHRLVSFKQTATVEREAGSEPVESKADRKKKKSGGDVPEDGEEGSIAAAIAAEERRSDGADETNDGEKVPTNDLEG